MADFHIKVSKKDCAKGFHGYWKPVAEDRSARAELCVVCGKKELYSKHPSLTTMDGTLDEMRWKKNHKLDLLQPWNPDKTVNKDFYTYYGEPKKFFEEEFEDTKGKFNDAPQL